MTSRSAIYKAFQLNDFLMVATKVSLQDCMVDFLLGTQACTFLQLSCSLHFRACQ